MHMACAVGTPSVTRVRPLGPRALLLRRHRRTGHAPRRRAARPVVRSLQPHPAPARGVRGAGAARVPARRVDAARRVYAAAAAPARSCRAGPRVTRARRLGTRGPARRPPDEARATRRWREDARSTARATQADEAAIAWTKAGPPAAGATAGRSASCWRGRASRSGGSRSCTCTTRPGAPGASAPIETLRAPAGARAARRGGGRRAVAPTRRCCSRAPARRRGVLFHGRARGSARGRSQVRRVAGAAAGTRSRRSLGAAKAAARRAAPAPPAGRHARALPLPRRVLAGARDAETARRRALRALLRPADPRARGGAALQAVRGGASARAPPFRRRGRGSAGARLAAPAGPDAGPYVHVNRFTTRPRAARRLAGHAPPARAVARAARQPGAASTRSRTAASPSRTCPRATWRARCCCSSPGRSARLRGDARRRSPSARPAAVVPVRGIERLGPRGARRLPRGAACPPSPSSTASSTRSTTRTGTIPTRRAARARTAPPCSARPRAGSWSTLGGYAPESLVITGSPQVRRAAARARARGTARPRAAIWACRTASAWWWWRAASAPSATRITPSAARSPALVRAIEGLAGVRAIVKPHPAEPADVLRRRAARDGSAPRHARLAARRDLLELLHAADALVTVESLSAVEALVLGPARGGAEHAHPPARAGGRRAWPWASRPGRGSATARCATRFDAGPVRDGLDRARARYLSELAMGVDGARHRAHRRPAARDGGAARPHGKAVMVGVIAMNPTTLTIGNRARSATGSPASCWRRSPPRTAARPTPRSGCWRRPSRWAPTASSSSSSAPSCWWCAAIRGRKDFDQIELSEKEWRKVLRAARGLGPGGAGGGVRPAVAGSWRRRRAPTPTRSTPPTWRTRSSSGRWPTRASRCCSRPAACRRRRCATRSRSRTARPVGAAARLPDLPDSGGGDPLPRARVLEGALPRAGRLPGPHGRRQRVRAGGARAGRGLGREPGGEALHARPQREGLRLPELAQARRTSTAWSSCCGRRSARRATARPPTARPRTATTATWRATSWPARSSRGARC